MVAYVVIPGIDGSDQEHWQTLWEQRWGAAAVRIAPQSWSHPDLPDWVAAVDRAVESAAAADREIVLVAHSLGCWAAAAWLDGEPDRPLRGAFLVAPPDPSAAAFPAEAASFLDIEPRPLRCRSTVVASTDDPYCGIGTATRLADSWGSDLQIVGDLGHINTTSRLGDWPGGQHLLESFLGGAGDKGVAAER